METVCISLFLLITTIDLFSQTKPNEQLSKFSIYLNTNIKPIASQNSQTILTYQGQLGLDYKLYKQIHVGIFGQTIFYHQNTEIANIDNKIIDLSSIEYNTLGFNLCLKYKLAKLIIYPKLDLGYNLFLAKAIDFSDDKKAFLDYRYLSLQPSLNLGFAVTENFSLGLNIGYSKQLIAMKGEILVEFNPNTVQGGVYALIAIK